MSVRNVRELVGGAFVGTLTADGYEPFTHSCTARDAQMAAEFICQTWLLGYPERRHAKNISVTFDEPSESTEAGDAK